MAIELLKTNWFGDLSLQAYYRFESGALTTDSCRTGTHPLTAISDPAEDASGKFGGAVALDGNDAYSAVDHADFKPTGAFTVGAWIKTNSVAATSDIMQSFAYPTSKWSGWSFYVQTDHKLYLTSGKNTGNVLNTDYARIISTTSVDDNTWRFVVGTWNGTHLNLYVNGVSDATAVAWANAPVYAATNYVRVGCQNNDGTNLSFFTGSLDDVFLLNGTALTASQIKNIYTGVAPSLLMNLAGNWKNN